GRHVDHFRVLGNRGALGLREDVEEVERDEAVGADHALEPTDQSTGDARASPAFHPFYAGPVRQKHGPRSTKARADRVDELGRAGHSTTRRSPQAPGRVWNRSRNMCRAKAGNTPTNSIGVPITTWLGKKPQSPGREHPAERLVLDSDRAGLLEIE